MDHDSKHENAIDAIIKSSATKVPNAKFGEQERIQRRILEYQLEKVRYPRNVFSLLNRWTLIPTTMVLAGLTLTTIKVHQSNEWHRQQVEEVLEDALGSLDNIDSTSDEPNSADPSLDDEI